jgi:hypothetical protein
MGSLIEYTADHFLLIEVHCSLIGAKDLNIIIAGRNPVADQS